MLSLSLTFVASVAINNSQGHAVEYLMLDWYGAGWKSVIVLCFYFLDVDIEYDFNLTLCIKIHPLVIASRVNGSHNFANSIFVEFIIDRKEDIYKM